MQEKELAFLIGHGDEVGSDAGKSEGRDAAPALIADVSHAERVAGSSIIALGMTLPGRTRGSACMARWPQVRGKAVSCL